MRTLFDKDQSLVARYFSAYLFLRTISAVGNEVWNMSLPIFAATAGWTSAQLGLILSVSSAFSVLAYLLSPSIILGRRSLAATSAFADLLQFIAFCSIGTYLTFQNPGNYYETVMVLACVASFLAGIWYIGNEALLPRLKDIGGAQDIQKRNFLSWTIGGSLGPAIAAPVFQVIGMSALLIINGLLFLGQAVSLWRLRPFEMVQPIQQQGAKRYFAALFGIFKSRFIMASSAYSVFIRIFTMGFTPFVVFRFKASGLSTQWLSILATASPGAMLIAVKLYKASSEKSLARAFVLTSCVFAASGFFMVWATLTGLSPYLVAILLVIFGAAIGVYTVQVRALRQMLTPPEDLVEVVASQTLWARCAAPLSGVLFGYVLSNLTTIEYLTHYCVILGVIGLALALLQGLALKMKTHHVLIATAALLCSYSSAKAVVTMNGPIRINVDSLPISLDPTKVRDIVADWVLGRAGNRLISTHADGTIKGDLAIHWKVLNNGERFEFTLRDDAVFSDGTRVKAADIKVNIEAARAAKANFSFYLDRLESVAAPNDRTVVFQMREPMPSFLQVLGEPMFTVHKRCGNSFCFTGPYTLGTFNDQYLDLVRRKDNQVFRLQQLAFNDALKSFNTGNLEILRTFGVGNLLSLDVQPDKKQVKFPDQLSYFVAFNSQRGRLQQAGTRQQIAAGFDFAAAERWLANAGVKPSKCLVSPTFFGSSLDRPRVESVLPVTSDKIPVLTMLVMDSHEIEPLAKALVARLPITVQSLPKKELLRRASEGDFDLLMIGYNVTLRDIDYLSIFFDSKSLHNFAKVNSQSIDALVKSAWISRSFHERRKAFADLLDLNNKESFYIPIAHAPVIYTLSKKIHLGGVMQSINATSFDIDNIKWSEQ